MFERYNVNDLFLANISVMYPDNMWDTNIGGMLMCGMAGYGYLTILRKDGDNYFDLQNPSAKITSTRNPDVTSYTIDYMEPLNKYYTQDGTKKDVLSKRKAIKTAKQYYDELHKNRLVELKRAEEEKTKSL